MVKSNKWYNVLISYIMIGLGSVLMALALNYFLSPNTIAPGGITGFAVVIEKITGIPVYLTNLAINIPLFIFGAKTLGRETGIKTLYSMIVLTLALKYIPYRFATHDLLLSALFGGVITGLGLGFVFKFGGTTGGTDLIGAILNRRFPTLSFSTFMMAIDTFVVIFAGVVEKNIEVSLYSIIALFASVKVVDLMLEGMGYLKAFYIITDKPEEISNILMEELERGVTSLRGKGMYSGEDKEVLLCVVNRAQFTRVKEIVEEIDPIAFVMVTEMYEVIGEGFKVKK